MSARETLLENSMEALRIRGYNALGVQEIADAAGLPKGSFYNHFQSKEDFAIAAIGKYLTGGIARTAVILQNPKVAAVTRILTLYEDRIRFEKTRLKNTPGCLLNGMAQEMSGTSEAIRGAVARAMRQLVEMLADCISEAMASNAIHPPVNAVKTAEYLEASWRGALLVSRAEHNLAPLKNFYLMLPVILGKEAD